MKITFKFLTGDTNWLDYGGKWVSQKLNNGDFDYWLVIELINMDDACGYENKGQAKYHVSLSMVSLSEAGENLAKALDSCGMDVTGAESIPLMQVEALHSYGVHAPLEQWNGNNAHQLLREARREAQNVGASHLEKTVNKIGSTAREFLRGDLESGLARTIASGSTTGNILAKMHGVPTAAERLQTATVRFIKQRDMRKCRFSIISIDHYREDGSCKCDDPEHQKMMIKEWGYTDKDFLPY